MSRILENSHDFAITRSDVDMTSLGLHVICPLYVWSITLPLVFNMYFIMNICVWNEHIPRGNNYMGYQGLILVKLGYHKIIESLLDIALFDGQHFCYLFPLNRKTFY